MKRNLPIINLQKGNVIVKKISKIMPPNDNGFLDEVFLYFV